MKVPTPFDALRLAEQSRRAVLDAIALVPRLVTIVGQVEQLLARVDGIMAAVEIVERRATHAVTDAQALLDRVDPIFVQYQASLTQLAPVIERLAETTDHREVDAVVKLMNHLPVIVDRIDGDILPILNTLDTVAPDLRGLLDASMELNEIITSIPGLGHKRSQESKARSRAEAAKGADEKPSDHPDQP